ncbi:MAG: hypothetical protein KatS3mg042_0549 [Rhodothermaceae bacterium]|nr:MAG: hypothetical protein KatS3mg042_0549 [Rhodothermaceae bacterium]
MVRIIIEVDSKEELADTLALLGDRPVTVQEVMPASDRAALLGEALRKYRIRLARGWTFDRDEAQER